MRASIFAICLLSSTVTVNAEIYKCVSDSGETTYADAPCGKNAVEIQPRSNHVAPDFDTRISARESLRETQRFINSRRIDREINESNRVIQGLHLRMQRELGALRRSQRISANNLAGATRDLSLAQEMTAVTQKYEALIRVEQAELARWYDVRTRFYKNTP